MAARPRLSGRRVSWYNQAHLFRVLLGNSLPLSWSAAGHAVTVAYSVTRAGVPSPGHDMDGDDDNLFGMGMAED